MQHDIQEDRSLENDFINNEEAKELERKYVYEVYEEIADHFSSTRYKAWPKVVEFLQSIESGSLVLDVGCGNGKNLKHTIGCFEIGCDTSLNLVKFCSQKSEVLVANCLLLPFRDNFADVVICIAVIHHMSTKERRQKALKEILRVLRPKGKCLIYVWAMEQEGPKGSSVYLKKTKTLSNNVIKDIQFSNSRTIHIPVHINRTNFTKKDLLVPYKSGSKEQHRYYHLFQEKELDSLILECGSHITNSYYDEGNWCAVFEK